MLRLMLAGSEPGRILCLTYTKAAAAEMANRVADRLGDWATADAARLEAKLFDLLGGKPTDDQRRMARQLFARVLDAPGGLEYPDHPCLLPIAACPLSARGGRGSAFGGHGRP